MLHVFRFLISKVFVINLIIIILLLSGALFSILHYLDDYTRHEKILQVPNVVNLNFSELDTMLAEEHGFTYEINDSVYVKGTKGGIVLEQSPRAETSVKQGRKIYLTMSAANPPKIGMPNLVDFSRRQAISLMETYGLDLGELIYKPDLCKDCVLEQQIDGEKIEAGEKIERGSTIDLVIGQGLGNELTAVPWLFEFKVEMAEILLKSKSLNLGSLIYDEEFVLTAEDTLNAVVYEYSPPYSEGPSVRMGTSIDLYLTIDTNKVGSDVNTDNPIDSI